MHLETKLLSLLGLCRRAGKLVLGNDPVLESITKQKCQLLLLVSDLSPKTEKKLLQKGTAVQCLRLDSTMEQLAYAVGKRVGVLAVEDSGFAKKIMELYTEAHKDRA